MMQEGMNMGRDEELQRELSRLETKLMEMSKLLMQKAVVAFFELSHLLYIILDERGKMVLANPAWTSLLGWTADDLHGRTLLPFIHPDDREKSLKAFEQALETGMLSGFLTRCKTKRGGFCDLEWFATSSDSEDFVYAIAKPGPNNLPMGRRLGYSNMKEDRIELDRQIRGLPTTMLKEAMLAFFEMSPLLFMIARSDGKILLVNPSWTRVLGYGMQEMLEKPIFELIYPDDIQPSIDVFSEIEQERASSSGFVNRYFTKEGGLVWLEWHGYPSRDGKYIFGVARALKTEQKPKN